MLAASSGEFKGDAGSSTPHDSTDEKFAAFMGRQKGKRLSAYQGGCAPNPPITALLLDPTIGALNCFHCVSVQ